MSIRMTVFGTGYLGATHAACMAELGHHVLGVDIDENLIASLQSGRAPFYEPGLNALLARGIETGRLRFTTSYREGADWSDVCFLCVGTPQKDGVLSADLRPLETAVTTLSGLMNRSTLLIGRSTVPVGTASRLKAIALEASPSGEAVEIAWNPEFIQEGCAVEGVLRPDRVVIGTEKRGRAEAVLRKVYDQQIKRNIPFLVSDLATAELTKTAANAFLATKISFINAMAEICESSGADVRFLADAVGRDTRIGSRFLQAGVGFGGGCLPKDIRALVARAEELGCSETMNWLREVDAINSRCRTRMVELTLEACDGTLSGRRIAVLGAAFKPNSDDVRDSPALEVSMRLLRLDAEVAVYDPRAMETSRSRFPALRYGNSVTEVCSQADAVLVLTDWPAFAMLRPDDIRDHVRSRTILDGRNCLDPKTWFSAGWRYHALGYGIGRE
ncbi:UDP-glucose dehydrogenase family protein [Nocardia sp. NPDC003999]